MKCREVLFKTRECRRCELEEYELFLKKSFDFSEKDVSIEIQRKVMYQTASGGAKSAGTHSFIAAPSSSIEQLIDKRRSYLTLELPFQTDATSLNHALVKSFPKNRPSKLRFPEDWAEQYFSREPTSKQLPEEKHILELIYQFWPKVVKEFEFDGEAIKITKITGAKVEDFVFDKIKADYFYAVDQLDMAEASKPIYKSHISSLINYLLFKDLINTNLLETDEINWSIKSGLDAYAVASYFEYLEARCLKKQSKDPYKDLIAIRLLFYAPATFKKLNQVCLKDVDPSKLTIGFEEVEFAVPSTFIKLADTLFSKEEPLFQMNVKQLNKFIQQTSEANKMKKITPTAIRQALRLICHQERFAVESLPRR